METCKVNDLEKISAKTIKDIRKKWPKHFPNEHKPPIDGVVVSVELRMPINDLTIKDITIVGPDTTEWDIAICGDEVIDYSITIPGPDIMESVLGEGLVDLLPSDQFVYLSPGPKLLKYIEPKPKKVIYRRIILD